MPIHDWTRVEAGIYHHFHQTWICTLCDSLNSGGLPDGFFALIERTFDDQHWTQLVHQGDAESYATKANRIAIRRSFETVVAVIEIVSPGNKHSRAALRSFVEKAVGFVRQGIHLLVIDLFPPSIRDPQGIHKAIWDELQDEPFELPPDKPLTLVAYQAGLVKTAYIEPVAVSDVLPDMPLFLAPDFHVPAPLEATYETTWSVCPEPLRELLSP